MSLLHNLLLLGTSPKNALEEALLAFLKERMEPPEFEAALTASRVTVLVKDPPHERPAHEGTRPLVVDGANGNPALCVFTHRDRATALAKRTPEYPYGMETDFSFVLSMALEGFGIVINPGTVFSTELPPEGVEALRR